MQTEKLIEGPGPGLTTQRAQELLAQFGANALPERAPESFTRRLIKQFQSPLIYVLLFALVVDLAVWAKEGAHGFPLESVVIAIILLLNAGLGVWQESKAEAALSRLKALAAPLVWARRDGEWRQVPATELVPGDWIRVEAGDRIPADARVGAMPLEVDESILTGESLPVEKGSNDEVYSGTLAVRGKTFAEVIRTGPESALGRLARMLSEVQAEQTPLERRLRKFGHQVARWVFVITLALVIEGVLTRGLSQLGEVFLFAVALAVAAVPEGLPAVLTSTLALGVERMAARKAVVRKLSAVEALGSVTVIATDKTGTLTENRMEVRRLDCVEGREEAALRACALANDADAAAGDPMDLALNRYVAEKGWDVEALRRAHPRVAERPFDSNQKFMRATVEEEGRAVSYLKGAPEVLIPRTALTSGEKQAWLEKALDYASQGHRVLALARGLGEAEIDLELLGLALFWDPPRAEVPGAIRQARDAGIRVLMVTGDHPETAKAIAGLAGIGAQRVVTGDELDRLSGEPLQKCVREVNIYARVRPEHKLKLVEQLQADGQIVAMTGDGVNDAPALKKADVGVAMGQRGSDVSREVADLVLLDDNFASIVAAIEEGRSIYENIQKFIRFLFSTNLSEVVVVSLGVLFAALLDLRDAGGALLIPLTAAQILWINLVTDGLPALSLALDRNPDTMKQPPRPPDSPLLDGNSRNFIWISGLAKSVFALGLLGTYQMGWLSMELARSVTFHFMSIGQLFFAYSARHTGLRPLPNRVLHGAVLLGLLVQLVVGTIPVTAKALGAVPLTSELWVLVLVCAVAVWGLSEVVNRCLWRGDGVRSRGVSAS
ncbi:MAG: cation-translocating P-type ATPase [Bryobacteraceae bacterium]|nr:cation-translocating P-type ATPase [Bryobacteraceae bacterium]MDW8378115.1 cation-translocating P-type ATPase [Bryobacterales bacterium]